MEAVGDEIGLEVYFIDQGKLRASKWHAMDSTREGKPSYGAKRWLFKPSDLTIVVRCPRAQISGAIFKKPAQPVSRRAGERQLRTGVKRTTARLNARWS